VYLSVERPLIVIHSILVPVQSKSNHIRLTTRLASSRELPVDEILLIFLAFFAVFSRFFYACSTIRTQKGTEAKICPDLNFFGAEQAFGGVFGGPVEPRKGCSIDSSSFKLQVYLYDQYCSDGNDWAKKS